METALRARLEALTPAARAELLHVLRLPDFDRADTIGTFWGHVRAHLAFRFEWNPDIPLRTKVHPVGPFGPLCRRKPNPSTLDATRIRRRAREVIQERGWRRAHPTEGGTAMRRSLFVAIGVFGALMLSATAAQAQSGHFVGPPRAPTRGPRSSAPARLRASAERRSRSARRRPVPRPLPAPTPRATSLRVRPSPRPLPEAPANCPRPGTDRSGSA